MEITIPLQEFSKLKKTLSHLTPLPYLEQEVGPDILQSPLPTLRFS